MINWRNPTESESRLIIEQEKHRFRRNMALVIVILLFSLFGLISMIVSGNITVINKRANKMLAEYPTREHSRSREERLRHNEELNTVILADQSQVTYIPSSDFFDYYDYDRSYPIRIDNRDE